MRAIAIMNNKGGVGKTVTAINLADILANDYKQRVVLVDCDGQANLTGFFLPGEDMDAVTTADVLTGDCDQVWSDNLIPLGERLELLPSSSGLYDLDLSAIKDGVGAPERMIGFVSAAREDGDVDWMIFDCPPGYTLASVYPGGQSKIIQSTSPSSRAADTKPIIRSGAPTPSLMALRSRSYRPELLGKSSKRSPRGMRLSLHT